MSTAEVSVRLVTFNVQHGQRTDGSGVDVIGLVEACRRLDADVLALQEVDRNVGRSGRVDLSGRIASALGMEQVFVPALRLGRGHYGNAVLVRGDASRPVLARLPPRGRSEPRVAVALTARTPWGRVRVVATHLHTDRALALDQLEVVCSSIDEVDGPCAVLGDLNLDAAAVEAVARRHRLAIVEAPPTFPAVAPWAQIDHVLLRGCTLARAEVIATGMSDHLALVVDVDLPD